MNPKAAAFLRYAIPAVAGIFIGMALEKYVWKGRY